MIHMPSKSSQKYPKGLPGPPELASMALRLLANRQSCRRFGVATSEVMLPLESTVSLTLKQGVVPVPMLPQGVGAKVPFAKVCLIPALKKGWACAKAMMEMKSVGDLLPSSM